MRVLSVAVSVALAAVLIRRVVFVTVLLLRVVLVAAAVSAALLLLLSRAAPALQAQAVLDVALVIYRAPVNVTPVWFLMLRALAA
eukprot:7234444-Alexandrium_andersonii.AAC.1